MREIKFRVWNVDEHISLNKAIHDDIVVIQVPSSSNNSLIEINWEGVELEQFTGMHDKNGVPIYEGDIVIVDDDYEKYGCSAGEKYEVIFNYGGFRLKPKYTNGKGFYLEDSEPYTVIGNIHQHAHLLEQSKC